MTTTFAHKFVIPKCQQDIVDFLQANEGSRFNVVMKGGLYLNVWVRCRHNSHHLAFRKYRAKNWFHGTNAENVLWIEVAQSQESSEYMYGNFQTPQ